MEGSAEEIYAQGHPSFQNRAMFVVSSPGKPEAAFILEDDPLKRQAEIKQEVALGYIARTRAMALTTKIKQAITARWMPPLAVVHKLYQPIITDRIRGIKPFQGYSKITLANFPIVSWQE